MICPRCNQDKMDDKKVRNALSRRDNSTYICCDCGLDEAMLDFAIALSDKKKKGDDV